MAYYALIERMEMQGSFINAMTSYIDSNQNAAIDQTPTDLHVLLDLNFDFSPANFRSVIETKVLAYASSQGYTGMTSSSIIWAAPNLMTPAQAIAAIAATTPKSFNYAPGRSIVTGTGATGFQVSSTRDSVVTYSTKITTTATIAGGQEGYVILEIAPTNSATAGDWKEVGRVTNGQALSLAITLQSIQPVSGILMGIVPAGYYVKVRSVNVTGTPSYSMVSGQEILI